MVVQLESGEWNWIDSCFYSKSCALLPRTGVDVRQGVSKSTTFGFVIYIDSWCYHVCGVRYANLIFLQFFAFKFDVWLKAAAVSFIQKCLDSICVKIRIRIIQDIIVQYHSVNNSLLCLFVLFQRYHFINIMEMNYFNMK